MTGEIIIMKFTKSHAAIGLALLLCVATGAQPNTSSKVYELEHVDPNLMSELLEILHSVRAERASRPNWPR